MKDRDLYDLFENTDFDVEVPPLHHEQRFLEKLSKEQSNKHKIIRLKPNYWKPLLSIAASLVLFVSVFSYLQKLDETSDLASISPEMANTQDFFTATIEEELNKLEKESSPEVIKIKQDAIKQIQILETEYKKLQTDLKVSGNDNRVIYAMISNFQNRIDILQSTLDQIENIKQIKNSSINLSESKI